MPKFSVKSKQKLSECDNRLQIIMNLAIQHIDFSIITGYRGENAQNEAYNSGKSKAKWGESKHNQTPSMAVDIAPYPIDWKDSARFIYLAGNIMIIAKLINVPLIWGGDWKNFFDGGHFEI